MQCGVGVDIIPELLSIFNVLGEELEKALVADGRFSFGEDVHAERGWGWEWYLAIGDVCALVEEFEHVVASLEFEISFLSWRHWA